MIVTSTANADPNPQDYELFKVPKGQTKIIDGYRHQCLNFDEFTLLLEFEASMVECEMETDLKDEKIELLELQITDLKIITQLQKQTGDAMKVENDRLFGLWKDENKKRHLAENKPHWGSWMGWTVAGVSTAVLAGFIIKDQLSD